MSDGEGGGRLALVAGAGPREERLAKSLSEAGFDARAVADPARWAGAAAGAFVVVRWMPGDGREDPVAGHVKNADGALAVLEAARAAQARRVVHAAPRQAGTAHAVQALAAELYCELYHRLHGVETVALRYPVGLSDEAVARAIRRAALGSDGLGGVFELEES